MCAESAAGFEGTLEGPAAAAAGAVVAGASAAPLPGPALALLACLAAALICFLGSSCSTSRSF